MPDYLDRCIDAGHDAEREWVATHLDAAPDAAAVLEAARAHLRACTRVHAYATHAADADGIALALIERDKAQAAVDRLT
jgi:hypothetical protein